MRLEAFGVAGIGEVAEGDDVAALVVAALSAGGETLPMVSRRYLRLMTPPAGTPAVRRGP